VTDKYYLQNSEDRTTIILFEVCVKDKGNTFPVKDHIRYYRFLLPHGSRVSNLLEVDHARKKWQKAINDGYTIISEFSFKEQVPLKNRPESTKG